MIDHYKQLEHHPSLPEIEFKMTSSLIAYTMSYRIHLECAGIKLFKYTKRKEECHLATAIHRITESNSPLTIFVKAKKFVHSIGKLWLIFFNIICVWIEYRSSMSNHRIQYQTNNHWLQKTVQYICIQFLHIQ